MSEKLATSASAWPPSATAASGSLAQIVLRGVAAPELVEHQEVPLAGHFSFMSPFPAERVSPSFPPSQDPPGFDRSAYQPVLAREVSQFLRRVLGT